MLFKQALIASGLATALFGTFMACGSDDDAAAGGSAAAGAQVGTGGLGIGGFSLEGGYSNTGGGQGLNVGDAGLDGDADVCASDVIAAEPVPASLLMLIDRTGSMNCNPPPLQQSADCEVNPQPVDPNQDTKWEITRDALSTAFTQLETSVPLPEIGVAFFNNDNYCAFPTEPDVAITQLSGDAGTDAHLAALQQSLQAVSPQGYTPIIGTVMGAYQYLHENADAFEGNRFVVLLTDGAETCDPENTDFLVQKSLEASWVGIRTFVLGAPGSEGARAMLSQIAYNGGTAADPSCEHSGADPMVGDCHMDMTLPGMDFATELAENLQRISVAALTCLFDVPQPGPGDPPVDLSKVNVSYSSGGGEPELILQDNNLPCDDPANEGWQYVNGGAQIQLCGAACETVKNDPSASVSIELGCETQVVPA